MVDLFGYETIRCFQGKYEFLSNFFVREIVYKDVRFLTTEHAFQWDKTTDPDEQRIVLAASTPGKVKRLGRQVTMRPDWAQLRFKTMFDINMAKFTQHLDLKENLLATEDAVLVEGNNWHDNFWGDCVCSRCANITGLNHLGKTLMQVRESIR
jgi:ribA/ribD-fused uncharacterized protein